MDHNLEPDAFRKRSFCECKRFDSLADIAGYVNPAHVGRYASESFLGRRFSSGSAILKKVNDAWQDGFDMLNRARKSVDSRVNCKPKSTKKKRRYSYTDGDIDVDRLLDSFGADKFYANRKAESKIQPQTITLAVGVGANCETKHYEIIWRGLAAIILTELLERSGFRVELVAYWYSMQAYTDNSGAFCSVVLKKGDQPLNLVSLVNGTSGWFFRSVMFGGVMTSEYGKQYTGDLGYSRPLNNDQLTKFFHRDVQLKIDEVWDQHACVDLVKSTIAKLDKGELIAQAA